MFVFTSRNAGIAITQGAIVLFLDLRPCQISTRTVLHCLRGDAVGF